VAATQRRAGELTEQDVYLLDMLHTTVERQQANLAQFRKDRNDHIARCVALGMPVARVAECLGISRRGVYKILDGA